MNVLFICRANLQRSPTAEELLEEKAGGEVNVKSAGVSPSAQTRVDSELIDWADRIYPMMEGIKMKIEEEFSDALKDKDVKVLGIPDRYIKGETRLKNRLIEEFSRDDFLSKYVK